MKITPNKTYTFKLVSGEEFLARVEEVHDTHLIVSHPISTVVTSQGLQMVPALFSSNLEENVWLNNNSYTMVATPREDVADSYLQATTGISVPPRKQIITG
jgi:hypothetical protein